MNGRGGPDTVAWSEDAVEEALDQYEQELSARLRKEVRLKASFRRDVRAAYGLDEGDAERNAAAVDEEDRERVACPHCATSVERVEERGLDHALDAGLTTRAYPVKQGEDEDRDAVLERAAERPEDMVSDATMSGNGVGREAYTQLLEEDRVEGLMYRETGCSEHDGVYLAMVKEGEARMEGGTLRPDLAPE